MAVDSIKDGFNWYQYCYSSPVKYYDPNGELPVPVIAAIIGGVVGGVTSALEEIGEQTLVDGKKLSEVDWGEVGKNTLIGIGVGAASSSASSVIGAKLVEVGAKSGVVAKIANSKIVQEGADTAIDFLGETISNRFKGNDWDSSIGNGLFTTVEGIMLPSFIDDITDGLPGNKLLDTLALNPYADGRKRSYNALTMWNTLDESRTVTIDLSREYLLKPAVVEKKSSGSVDPIISMSVYMNLLITRKIISESTSVMLQKMYMEKNGIPMSLVREGFMQYSGS